MTRFPLHLERAFAARLLRRLRIARRLVLERVRHRTDSRLDNRVGDEPAPALTPPTATVEAVRTAYEVALPLEFDSLLPTARAVDAFATRQTVREVSQLVGVNLERDARLGGASRDEHWRWARENVALIRTMEADTFDDLAEHVAAAVVEGRTDLDAVIRERFGVAEGRARLIARDQIAKLNGRITAERQTALGVSRYEWSTSGDERVRPKHRALNGTIRRWDQPHPTEGHPGSAIACRCTAIAVLDDVEVTPDPAEAPAPPRPSPLPSTFGGPVPVPPRTLPATFGDVPTAPPSEWLRARLSDRADRRNKRPRWSRS